MQTFYTMTPMGSRGSNIEAETVEDAQAQALQMGYDIVDVVDYEQHVCFVFLDEPPDDPKPWLPGSLGCWECGGFDGVHAPERKVVDLGPVVNRADPTQTYRLECGHLTI